MPTYNDDFNRADGPVDVGAPIPWSDIDGGAMCQIVSNQLTTDQLSTGARIDDGTTMETQYAQYEFVTPPTGNTYNTATLCVRYDALATQGIALGVYPDRCRLWNEETGAFYGATHNFTPQAGDIIRMEAEQGSVRVLINGNEVLNETDGGMTGGTPGIIIQSWDGAYPVIDNWESGGVYASELAINNVNGGNTVRNNEAITINGNELNTQTSVVLTDGVDSHPLVVSSATSGQLVCDPIDITSGKLPYHSVADGTIQLQVIAASGTVSLNIQLLPETGHEYVVLTQASNEYLCQGLNAQVGWQVEVDDTIGQSEVLPQTDGDCWYNPMVPSATDHHCNVYDADSKVWYWGEVGINHPPVAPDVPVWTATPNPPEGTVGVAYSYAIGSLLDGERPMTLADGAVGLPPGLSYNDSISPEVIEGTPTNTGSWPGITCNATNTHGGPVESSAFALPIGAAPPVDVAPTWNGTPTPPDADEGVAYSYAVGNFIDGTRPITLTGILPAGLAYDDSVQPELITGTPTASGSTNITTTATNGEGSNDSAQYSLNVRPAYVPVPPSWRATPSPPTFRANSGPIRYEIGALLEGDRPMTLTDAGTPLPAGCYYDNTPNAEAIVADNISQDGTFAGVITRATNDA